MSTFSIKKREKRSKSLCIPIHRGSPVDETLASETFLPSIRKNSTQRVAKNGTSIVYLANINEEEPEKSRRSSVARSLLPARQHRRYSLNIPATMSSLRRRVSFADEIHHLTPYDRSKRTSLESNMSDQNDDLSCLKFGAFLSSSAQCALLKSYEDELYNRMHMHMPSEKLSRVTTAKYARPRRSSSIRLPKINTTSHRSSTYETTAALLFYDDSIAEETEEKEDEVEDDEDDDDDDDEDLENINKNKNTKLSQIRSDSKNNSDFKLLKRFDDIMNRAKIANHLDKAMNLIDMLERSDEKSLPKVVRKYERWQHKWSKMLDECF